MTLPLWLTITPSRVVQDAGLSSDQVEALADEAKLLTIAGERLQAACDVVVTRARAKAGAYGWPLSLEQWSAAYPLASDTADRRDTQARLASDVAKALAVASLHKFLPGEEHEAQAKAIADGRGEAIIGSARFGSAEDAIKTLEADVELVATALTAALATPKKKRKRFAIYTGRGDT
jgi:hypothetical protein